MNPEEQADYKSMLINQHGFTKEEADAYLSEHLGASQEPQKESVSKLESGGLGALQGGSFGLADEAEAGLRSLGGRDYKDILKEVRDRYAKAQKENPGSYMAGELGGGVGSAFIPGVGAANGVGTIGRIGRAGLQGILAGYGYSTGDTAEQKLKDIGSGGITGLTAGGVSEVAPVIGTGLRSLAEKMGLAHLRPVPSTVRQLGNERLLNAAGEAIDNGSIRFGSKVGKTAERLEPIAKQYGKDLSDIVSKSDAKIDPVAVADGFESVIAPLRKAPAGNDSLIKSLEKEKDIFLRNHAPQLPQELIPLATSEAEKTALAGRAWSNPSEKPLIKKLKAFAAILGNAGSEAETSPAFALAKEKSGNALNALSMAQKSASIKGLMAHGVDIGVGLEAANLLTSDDPMKRKLGQLLAIGRVGTKGRLASSGAVTANALSKLLQSPGAQNALSRAIQTEAISSPWDKISLTGE